MKSTGALIALMSCALFGCDSGSGQPATGAPDTTDPQASGASSAPPAAASLVASAAASAAVDKPTNGAKGPFPASKHAAMLDPKKAQVTAPEKFTARFETTAGDFVVSCTRSWAPHGADRFYNLLEIGFYDDVAIYRVHPGFVVQWGIHGDPDVSKVWQKAQLEPDPITKKNKAGTLTFAQAGNPPEKGKTPLTRATQVFINYQDNEHLDAAFAPVCTVTQGFEITKTFGGEKLHAHLKNAQGRILEKGNAFLRKNYPELDYIKKAYVIRDDAKPASSSASSSAPAPPPAP